MPSQAKVDRSANQVLSFNIIPAAPKLEVREFSRLNADCHLSNLQLSQSILKLQTLAAAVM